MLPAILQRRGEIQGNGQSVRFASGTLPPTLIPGRALAEQVFSRAAGAPLVVGNTIRLLVDAKENYPAWMDSLESANTSIHFEMYILHQDKTGLSLPKF